MAAPGLSHPCCLNRVILSSTFVRYLPAPYRLCNHHWTSYCIQAIDYVVGWGLAPMSTSKPHVLRVGEKLGAFTWVRGMNSGLTKKKKKISPMPMKTQIYLGIHSKLFPCLAPIQISPWHLTGRLHGLYFGIVPPSTSSVTHSVIPGNDGMLSLRSLVGRLVGRCTWQTCRIKRKHQLTPSWHCWTMAITQTGDLEIEGDWRPSFYLNCCSSTDRMHWSHFLS